MPDHTRGTELGRIREGNEMRSPLQGFQQRLVELGATPDEVDAVSEQWDNFDDDWTPARQAELRAMGDRELRALIREVRDDYEVGTVTEEDHDAAVADAARIAVLDEAWQVVDQSVDKVLAWVGDDLVRAEAVLAIENDPGADSPPRRTLVEPLQDMLNAAAPPEPAAQE